MKRIGMLLVAIAIAVLLFAVPVLAASLNISPPSVEFSVPANGSTEVEFSTYDFSGKLNISLENIPLKVEPTTVSVKKGDKVVLTFHGDESLGSQAFDGKIRFLAIIGDSVGIGIKVKASVTNLVEGQPVSEKPVVVNLPPETSKPTPPEPTVPPVPTISAPPVPQASSEPPTPPLPPYPQKTEFPIIPAVAIAAGVVVAVTLIVTLVRRRRY